MDILNSNIKYLIVKVIKIVNCISITPIVTALEVDSNDIYIYDGTNYFNTRIFENFTIGIILDDDILLKKDTGLLLKKKKKYKYNNYFWTSQNLYLKKKYHLEKDFISKFSLFLINNVDEVIPFYIPCNIINIDYNKKYIDLSISEYYSIYQ